MTPEHQSAPFGTDPFIQISALNKTFHTLDAEIVAADDINLDLDAGTVTALQGPSGSGKSTLLQMIGALDRPDSGSIIVDGTNITHVPKRQIAAYRRTVGFVFQRFNLLSSLTVLDNVLTPVLPYKTTFDAEARARDLLTLVGLAGREHTLATRLSGGQQQRVAIARALINKPRLILADEPTGNLDTTTGEDIIRLLFDLRDQQGATLLIATHDPDLAKRCDRTIHMRDGKITQNLV
jgi:ABC-type lipoprotein export system ATPase subunit